MNIEPVTHFDKLCTPAASGILLFGKVPSAKDEIIQKGKEIFGDEFTYLDEYLEPVQYTQKLAQNDILILNQNRQQGIQLHRINKVHTKNGKIKVIQLVKKSIEQF